jgi:hypothetical protein
VPKLQIIVPNAPRFGAGAFAPVPYGATTPAASSGGVIRTEGHPGTVQVPSPAPAALNDGELGGPRNQNSRCSPDYFRPSIYIPHISRRTTGAVPTTSTNVAPVPAGVSARSAAQTQHKVRVGGRTVTAWPRQFTRWPTYREVAK